jgi:hypothetical protein
MSGLTIQFLKRVNSLVRVVLICFLMPCAASYQVSQSEMEE